MLLTHHHRDTAAFAGRYLADKVPVRAPKASADWLTPDGVQKYWKESLPLRNSRTAYLVLPEGLDGVDCSLADGQTIDWHGWQLRVVESPGHSRDHVAYAARKGKDGPLLLFCGDALAAPGKLWSPYTTDWDHWTDLGLKPTATIAAQTRRPEAGRAAAGPRRRHRPATRPAPWSSTADAVDGGRPSSRASSATPRNASRNAPQYAFLAKEQAESNGSKPWSRISEHLYQHRQHLCPRFEGRAGRTW